MLGGSLLLGSALAWAREPSSVPRVATLIVQTVVAILWMRRSVARETSSVADWGASAPAVLMGGLAFLWAAPWHEWPHLALVVFAAGAAWTAVTLAVLGRSFAVFPARRDVVTRGPYRWLRHPAYFGQLLMVGACAVTTSGWSAAALLILATVAVALRIAVEERFLLQSPEYGRYAARVRYRVVPFVW